MTGILDAFSNAVDDNADHWPIHHVANFLHYLHNPTMGVVPRMLWLFTHVATGTSFLATALSTLFPNKLPALRDAASIGHLILGVCLLLFPGSFLGITVHGNFNALHSFLQAYCAPFHLALAYFLMSPGAIPQEKPFVFAGMFCALLSFLTRLFTAWHLTERSTRGLLMTNMFVLCAFLAEGAWLACESVKLYKHRRRAQEEVDQVYKRTNLMAEGKSSFYLENVFYIDSAVCLLTAMTHFAFPQHILKMLITSEYILDSHHLMWCRMFGCLCLLPALCSYAARYLPSHVQIHYLTSRLITQALVFLLNVFGHWVLSIYSPNHISGFMLSGLYASFLFSALYRASSHFKDLPLLTVRKSKAM